MLKIVDEQSRSEDELSLEGTLDDMALAGAQHMLKLALEAEIRA